MAQVVICDASLASAYLMFNFPGSHANVYLRVECEFTSASLAAMKTFGVVNSPSMLSIYSDPSCPYGCFPFFDQDIFGHDSTGGLNPTYDVWRDEWGVSDFASGPVPDAPVVLETFIKKVGSGGYFNINGGSAVSDVATGVDMVGITAGLGVGGPGAGRVLTITRIVAGTTDGASDLLDFDASTATDLSAFTVVGNVTLVDLIPPFSGVRFFQGYPWRFLFTAIDVSDPFNPHVTETTSWADGLLTARSIVKTLGQSTVISAAVWPDDIRVNELWIDGYPRVAQSKRMVWAFRRENQDPTHPWVCRAVGILMTPQDEGDADVPLTHFTAYDPRKYLEARPVMDAGGGLPGPNGFVTPTPIPGNQIALDYLKNTITFEGGVFIDAGPSYGGTVYYGGTVETTDNIVFSIQQGSSVADVWNQLEATGNMDIILTPIYDPIRRPGYTHEVSIYKLAGSKRPSAVFAWDRLNRSVTKISRLHDATPGAFFDKVWYHAGQGGPPVPLTGPLVNAPAVTAFGSYWQIQFFPTMTSIDPTGAAVLALASQALKLAKQGKRTLTLDPTPERAPVPLLGYDIGDRVPVFATKRLRVTADGYQRIEAIPIQVEDDGIERISSLLVSPDWRGSTDGPVDPPTQAQSTIRTSLVSIQPQTGRRVATVTQARIGAFRGRY